MRISFLIVIAALLLSGNKLHGQPGSFDPEIRKFYLNTDTVAGNRLLKQRYAANNPEFLRIIGYREFLNCILHQSNVNTDLFFSRSDEWIRQLGKIRPASPGQLAASAEMHLYRAVLASQISDYKTSASELLSSYKIVAKSGAGFAASDRNKLSGILGVIFQQIPQQHLKYLKLVGVRPSGLSGFNGLERYYGAALPGTIERMEGYLMLVTALKEFSKDPAAAWNFVKTEGKPMLDNPLIRYQSSLAALKAGDCESALKLLDEKGLIPGKAAIPYWNYQTGRCLLYKNDLLAVTYLEKFIENPGGDNYRHSAMLMAGWYYLIHGRQDKAVDYFQRIQDLPAPLTVYDKQALAEAATEKMPDAEVLKARLLFDGGYYENCLDLCNGMIRSGKYGGSDEGELIYRVARSEQRLGRNDEAVKNFMEVINRESSIRSYLVPNSALQLGHIYNKSGQYELARKYYKVCVELNKYGLREGLNRQAQAALRELEK